jgi:hypothetical protein
MFGFKNNVESKTNDKLIMNYFVGSSSFFEITQVLMRLSEKCSICSGRKMHICMEIMCQKRSLLCFKCEQF